MTYIIYLDVVALIFVNSDSTIPRLQRFVQSGLIILVPIIGATLALHLNFGDSRRAIRWLPWPIANIISDGEVKTYRKLGVDDLDDIDES